MIYTQDKYFVKALAERSLYANMEPVTLDEIMAVAQQPRMAIQRYDAPHIGRIMQPDSAECADLLYANQSGTKEG